MKRELSENVKLYPLTHPQKRVWYIEKINSSTPLHNIGGIVRIKGKVRPDLLVEAINIFVKKNDGIRLCFVEKEGDVWQYVGEYKRNTIDIMDFCIYEDTEKELNLWMEMQACKIFDIYNDELYYFSLFKMGNDEYGVFARFHHIISDGWSVYLYLNRVCKHYMSLERGEEIGDENQSSYINYIFQEQQYLSSQKLKKYQEYWKQKFSVLPETFMHKSMQNTKGQRKSRILDSLRLQAIKEFCNFQHCSLNTFFIMIILLYIYKTTGEKDIVIGTPVLNRSGRKEKGIFGMFTSTMPFRIKLEGEYSCIQLLGEVGKELKNCYLNQKYPYDFLVQDLELRKKGYDGLFNISVNYYNTKMETQLNGMPTEIVEFYSGNQAYPLQVVIKEWSSDGLTVYLDYQTESYKEYQIEYMMQCIFTLVERVLAKPETILGNISCLTLDEVRKNIYEYNFTTSIYPKEKTIIQLFEEQVDRTPQNIAIEFGEQQLTFTELNQKSNQLARWLRDKGIGRNDIVGIISVHSIEAIVGVLGVLKAGGAYLPIDPECPAERMEYLLRDSQANVLFVHCNMSSIPDFQGEIVFLNDTNIFTGEGANLQAVNNTRDLAYIIYTSGSTGKPKGVMVEHQGVVNYIWWARMVYIKEDRDVFAMYSSLAFDLTVTSIFTPLISGNKMVVYYDDKSEFILDKIMRENKCSIIKLTPAHLSLLKDRDNKGSSVKRFIVGGEDLKVNLAEAIYQSFAGNIEIYNEYGPTETVVGCMVHRYESGKDTGISVPIGVPADNVQIYILDTYLNPVPTESIGEMYISGDGVARGYLNREDLTREKFIENPFVMGKKMYKTGDLARFLTNGKIEYAGRIDQQVKIKGYRIELGEIEKHLLQHESIQEAVVIDRENESGMKYLCAYLVVIEPVEESEIRKYLLKMLPEYMIPQNYCYLKDIPLTGNGKVNRALLPEPDRKIKTVTKYVGPANELEEKLLDTIKSIVNMEKISMKDAFYELGGDSIKAIQLAAKMSDAGFKLKVKDILSHPVIEDMVLYVKYRQEMYMIQKECKGHIQPTPISEWFFSQRLKNVNHYNQSVVLALKEELSVQILEQAFQKVISVHDSLRINYNIEERQLFYNEFHLEKTHTIEVLDLSGLNRFQQKAEMIKKGGELKACFNIENDILIKLCIFNLGPNGKRLLLTAHHLVVDGVSWRIIIDDLAWFYKQLLHGNDVKIPSKTNSVQDWASVLAASGKSMVKEEIDFWNSALRDNRNFPIDFDMGEDTIQFCQTVEEWLDEKYTTDLLFNAVQTYKTEPFDLLIVALALTIRDFTQSDNVTIELEGHGREEVFDQIDISRTVGWFTTIYPVKLKVDNELSVSIKSIKEQIRKIPNRGLGFGILKYLSGEIEDERGNSRIRFNYMGDTVISGDNELFSFSWDDSGDECSKMNNMTCLIDITAMIIEGRMKINLAYSINKFKHETIKEFMERYTGYLKEIIRYCCEKEESEFTSSDFDTLNLSEFDLDTLFN
ncbi:non-ribosomal peptide synthetase [Pseudobacteroides cellulosolvens]|uniref:Amino acid adenylation domain protein n=1 Tax=Pseudobacteroides cellulosolvens ATCC 35603 = DSM 2933 TaxID=398512 RepID=A0A0L6JGG2_9FIRM|nr:non-ribosomal peptide synthetase [Pseudobacteroides cellulosolvens]KNY24961.1 amino acid adenylation domain protein [Pseudobacteroides cellulosolvens ATCC 35603 = DSM 2933]